MPDLGNVPWPPAPITTERLVLRAPEARDRPAFVERDGTMIGHVLLRRADRHRPAAVGKIDLGYLFLPRAWGSGYAFEACSAALTWLDGVLPGEPVVLATQTADAASMRLAARLGFVERERLHAWDADQWLGERLAAAA